MSRFIVKSVAIALSTIFILTFSAPGLHAQQVPADNRLPVADLPHVIQFAVRNQPLIQQSIIDEEITELQIKARLADWYPQVNMGYLFQHNFQVQQTIIGGNLIRLGVNNTSALQFSATQTIFNRDVLAARRTRDDAELQAKQRTTSTKIEVIANVSKAFYAVLATEQQINVSDETILRLQRSLNDAKSKYEVGVVDKTDYKRALIALNNAVATRQAQGEALKARLENLKSAMNYPADAPLDIVYDSASLEREVFVDTLQPIDISRRVEYQLLQTRKRLLNTNLQYNKWAFIPSLSANGAYNLNYLNNDFPKLYAESYPNSYAGLTLSYPLFQGGKRKLNIREARYELKRLDLDFTDLQNTVNTEYHTALATYKADLIAFRTIKENVALAQEVYDVIELQYRAGVKAYLELITAESDLRTAQINYFNSLYLLLSSKIDVEKALGNINGNQ